MRVLIAAAAGIALGRLVAVPLWLVGVVVVASGTSGPSTLLGDFVAFMMTLTFAIIIVLAKAYPGLKLPEITALSAILIFLIFMPFASGTNLDLHNWLVVSLYGFVSIVFAFLLFLRGARQIPAAMSGLILTLDIALSPYWLWIFYNERVDLLTFIGGAIFAVAVGGPRPAARRATTAPGT